MAFWRAVKEAGLLEEVVEDFQKELQQVLKGLEERVCEPPLQVKGQRDICTHTHTLACKTAGESSLTVLSRSPLQSSDLLPSSLGAP